MVHEVVAPGSGLAECNMLYCKFLKEDANAVFPLLFASSHERVLVLRFRGFLPL